MYAHRVNSSLGSGVLASFHGSGTKMCALVEQPWSCCLKCRYERSSQDSGVQGMRGVGGKGWQPFSRDGGTAMSSGSDPAAAMAGGYLSGVGVGFLCGAGCCGRCQHTVESCAVKAAGILSWGCMRSSVAKAAWLLCRASHQRDLRGTHHMPYTGCLHPSLFLAISRCLS